MRITAAVPAISILALALMGLFCPAWAEEAWDCRCGVDRTCDIHPMIQAIAAASAQCGRSSDEGCGMHPMFEALLEAYKKSPEQFSEDRWPAHPMVRAMLKARSESGASSGPGSCCNHPMIRSILDCLKKADRPPAVP